MKRYVVIGGQYDSYFYGSFDSLHAAKICATQHEEYWDNWQGWHKPKIYSSRQVELVNNFYGKQYCPKYDATPLYVWDSEAKKWVSGGCYV